MDLTLKEQWTKQIKEAVENGKSSISIDLIKSYLIKIISLHMVRMTKNIIIKTKEVN
jgi:hypothetical protein